MQLRILTAALALSLPACALAQTSDATDLDQITVTATRTAVTVDQSLAPVDVIDRAQIERSQARSLPELLRGHAGINLVNQGGAGKLTTLFLRGTESDHVLFLVDGVRIGSATSGLASLQDLPVDQIERVEIVRGPRSSLYGADAIGGVIQIFTRHRSNGVQPQVRLGLGSHGLREANAGISVGSERAWFGADLAYQRTDGINACNVATPSPYSGGCFIAVAQPDRDGYRNRSLSLHGGFVPSDALTLEANALRVEGHNDYDGDFVDSSDIVQQVVGGHAKWQASDAFKLQLTAGRNVDASDNFLGATPMGTFSTGRDSATLQGDVTITPGQLLTLGLDWLRDRVDSDTPYDETTRGNHAGFAQYQGRFGRHDVQLSLRHDDNEQFGGHSTGGAAWGIDLGHELRLSADYGTAFKAPTFNELYYPFFGNPALKPEQSQSLDVGIAQHRDAWHWRLDAFETRVDDLITYDASIGLPNNIDRAHIRGAELGAGTRILGWDAAGQLSYADPRAGSGFHDGNRLPRRARETARLDLDHAFGALRIGLTGIAEGARYDDFANTMRLGGYATLDLRIEYALSKDWLLQAHATNLFDREYETAAFYNQPGREFAVSLRWRPAQ